MRAHPDMREVHRDNTGPAATLRFVLDQSRLRQIGLSPAEAAQQLQFLLDGVTVTGWPVGTVVRGARVMVRGRAVTVVESRLRLAGGTPVYLSDDLAACRLARRARQGRETG